MKQNAFGRKDKAEHTAWNATMEFDSENLTKYFS